ncbi:hypothetical protein Patl1_05600 [Pistacia atlantica]|uniref:Uncharacterized protein n=1 Tax=Pistacia atlantica TaxID=434234 RepID=A0ACC1BW19_9ROSI|nr:hypothetical protein Patl1_05600 [Pistacia atlantica]
MNVKVDKPLERVVDESKVGELVHEYVSNKDLMLIEFSFICRMAEHVYVSNRADEERKKRPSYRPIIEHDVLPKKQSSNQVMRDIIEEHMDEIKQAGGISCFVKGDEEVGMDAFIKTPCTGS